MRVLSFIAAIALVVAASLVPTIVSAQATSDVTQEINGGVLSAAILTSGRVVVPSPSFAMSPTTFSFDCQATTGTLGAAEQRLYVLNPSATTSGQSWTLTMAATGPWADGPNTYSYNTAAGAGCTSGQLTVNPNAGTVVADCTSTACTGAVITKGTSTAMTGTTPVTILSAPTGTSIWRGYITGVGLSQQIPAETPAGNYSLPVTLTATAS